MYTPDIRHYQQIPLGGPTGPDDCSGWSGAILVDAHTQGATKTTGRAIRLHSTEPIPDKNSPGLNLPQVDTSVLDITNGHVNLDTKVQSEALTRAQAQTRIIDGRWATVQIWRGILVARGYGGGNHFSEGHALTVHARPIDNTPVLGDPLVAHYIPADWDALWDAAEYFVHGFAPGKVYTQLTRDLTPDYRISIKPTPPAKAVTFVQYLINPTGAIKGRRMHTTTGLNRPCTPPTWHESAIKGVTAKRLVMFTTAKGTKMWVDARYAYEIYP